MSLARAFTTRRVKQTFHIGGDSDGIPQRSNTTKGSTRLLRPKISGPVELIHTTNMLSYNAPDVPPQSATSSTSSDDLSDGVRTDASSPPTSPDIPAPSKRPASPSPEPNHLSCYFTPPGQSPPPEVKNAAPLIPKRAPSHTKKSSEGLFRQRSMSRLSEHSGRTVSTKSSFTFSRTSSGSTSTAATQHSVSSQSKAPAAAVSQPTQPTMPTPTKVQPVSPHQARKKEVSQPSQEPFRHELARVTEIAEEFGLKEKVAMVESEEQQLSAQGLRKFRAEDYLSEMAGLFEYFMVDARPAPTVMWI